MKVNKDSLSWGHFSFLQTKCGNYYNLNVCASQARLKTQPAPFTPPCGLPTLQLHPLHQNQLMLGSICLGSACCDSSCWYAKLSLSTHSLMLNFFQWSGTEMFLVVQCSTALQMPLQKYYVNRPLHSLC